MPEAGCDRMKHPFVAPAPATFVSPAKPARGPRACPGHDPGAAVRRLLLGSAFAGTTASFDSDRKPLHGMSAGYASRSPAPPQEPPHAAPPLRLDHGARLAPQRALGLGRRVLHGKLVLPDPARRHDRAHGAGPPGPRLGHRAGRDRDLRRRRHRRLRDRILPVRDHRPVDHRLLRLPGQVRGVPAGLQPLGLVDHPHQGHDADPLQARHHRERSRRVRLPHLRAGFDRDTGASLLPGRGPASRLRCADPRFRRASPNPGRDALRRCNRH
jgi:hypothetical protein